MNSKLTRHKITREFLRALAPTGHYQEFADAELRGFGVKVTPTGTITYTYRWRKPDATQARRVIARWPHMQPGEARELARREAATLDHKGDTLTLLAERRQKRTALQKVAGMPTLRTFLTDRYDDHLRTHTKTGTRNADMIRAGFADLLDTPMDEVTAWVVEKWRSAQLKAGNRPSTCNRKLNALRGVFSRAVEWHILDTHPLKTVKKQAEPSGIVRWLSDAEDGRLHAALDAREARLRAEQKEVRRGRRRRIGQDGHVFADALKPAVLVSLNCGLRRGELLGLRWSDVDLERALLTVTDENAKSRTQRHIPLNREALDTLKAWQKQAHPVHLFADRKGEPLRELKDWQQVQKAAQLVKFRWHDLRHTFASRLVMAGVDLNTVRELLGHADLKMTLRYAHLSPEHKRAAVAVLEQCATPSPVALAG